MKLIHEATGVLVEVGDDYGVELLSAGFIEVGKKLAKGKKPAKTEAGE